MQKYDLCCVGHITLDKVVTPRRTVHMPGGTAYYFSKAISQFNHIEYALLTAVGQTELHEVEKLRDQSIPVSIMPSRHSVCFENIYGENQDNRTQRVSAKADPFNIDFFKETEASIFHLGTLLADDFPLEVVKYLSGKGLISIDVQGYLRKVRDEQVFPVDWPEKLEALPYIHFLKVNELEMEVLTGSDNVEEAAKKLFAWGVKEVLITLGSMGSVIFDGEHFYRIPAYKPVEVIDATGCGDTYMTGYLYKRALGAGIEEAGHFAAAMSTLKIERTGPFSGDEQQVLNCMKEAEQTFGK